MDLTWLGHATVLIEAAGMRIVTDPLLTRRVAHLRRRVPVPTLDPVDVVLVSHVHMDHLHLPSLRLVSSARRVVVPAGAERLVERLGFGVVTAVGAGDRVELEGGGGNVIIEVVQANHLRGRGPHTRVRADPVGYVVRAGGRSAYFAGDTDLFDSMRELASVDVALLPIWGWGPTLGERHLDPRTAAIATEWIAPTTVLPIHWGTYSPFRPLPGAPAWIDDPPAAFAEELAGRGLERRLAGIRPGGTLRLD